MIALEDVPNARIADAVGSLAMGEQLEWSGNEMVSSLESRQAQVEHRKEISLSQLEDLAGEFGWRLNVSWARHEKDGALDVVFPVMKCPSNFDPKIPKVDRLRRWPINPPVQQDVPTSRGAFELS